MFCLTVSCDWLATLLQHDTEEKYKTVLFFSRKQQHDMDENNFLLQKPSVVYSGDVQFFFFAYKVLLFNFVKLVIVSVSNISC